MRRAAAFLAVLSCAIAGAVGAEEGSQRFLSRVIAQSEPHRNALSALVKGRRDIPIWVRSMVSRDNYVALGSRAVEVGGRPMELFPACQAGNCPASAITVLFSPDGKRVVMRIDDAKDGEVLLGEPSAEEKKALTPADD